MWQNVMLRYKLQLVHTIYIYNASKGNKKKTNSKFLPMTD